MNQNTREALISFVFSTAKTICVCDLISRLASPSEKIFWLDELHASNCPVLKAKRLFENLRADETEI